MKLRLLPKLDESCLKDHLRTASFVITVIAMIANTVYAVIQFIELVNYYNSYEQYLSSRVNMPDYYTPYRSSKRLYEHAIYASAFTFFLIMSIILYAGVQKKNPRLMCPGVLVFGVVLSFDILYTFNVAWNLGLNSYVFRRLCHIVILYYCFAILYHYYKQLKETIPNGYNNFSQWILTQEAALAGDKPMKVEKADSN